MAKSTLSSIIPLMVSLILLGIIAIVGFVAYQIACDVADKTGKKMEKKNLSLSKDGLKVGVKEVSAEQVGDSTQNVLMKAWNTSTWQGYQSKLGWGKGAKTNAPSISGADRRKTYSSLKPHAT